MLLTIGIIGTLILQCGLTGIFDNALLHRRYSITPTILLWSTYWGWNMMIKLVPLPIPPDRLTYVSLMGALTTHLLILVLGYRDSLRHKFFVLGITYIITFMSEVIVELIHIRFLRDHADQLFTAKGTFFRFQIMLEGGIVLAVGAAIAYLFLKRHDIHRYRQDAFPIFLLFFPFVVCGTALYTQEAFFLSSYEINPQILIVKLVITSVLSMLWLGWIWFRYVQTQLQYSLVEEKQLRELEQYQYQEVLVKRQLLMKICEDYKGQLSHIRDCIQHQDVDTADSCVTGLARKIQATKEKPYCDLPVLNALLAQKEAECQAQDICLMSDLSGIDLINAQNLDSHDMSHLKVQLCSILSNLLDNAIRATAEYPGESGIPREIHLTASRQQEYLVIRVNNPSLPPATVLRPEHGLGSKILTKIAQNYHGEYVTEYGEERFKAAVVLKIPEE